MRRLVTTAGAALGLAILAGCSPKPMQKISGPKGAERVTVEQLGEATKGQPFISYVGTQGEFHYFASPAIPPGEYPDRKYFKIATSTCQMPPEATWPIGDKELFLTVRDGKLTAPAARSMSGNAAREMVPK